MIETGPIARLGLTAAALLVTLGSASAGSAQRDLTDGDATFDINSFTGVPWSADFAADGDDDLFSFGFYHRVGGATRERIFGAPDTEDFTGNTALLSWTDFDGSGLNADLTITLTGLTSSRAHIDLVLDVHNPTGAPVPIDLFGATDLDMGGSSGNVAVLDGAEMQIDSASGDRSAVFSATPMWTNYSAGDFSDVYTPLNDSDVDNYDSTGLPFTGDFRGGYQWTTTIAANGTETVALRIAYEPPRNVCGNGVTEPGNSEVCDDGFNDACGTCNADCTAVGTGASCGDGVVCPELEACDDTFTDACGSCNADCTDAGTPSVCGDGDRCVETEQCDDSNTDVGDGCSPMCTIERRLADNAAVFDELLTAFGALDFSADGTLDQYASHGLFYRAGADTAESPFPPADTDVWAGNVGMLAWTDFDGTGLDAVAVITLIGTDAANASATVVLTVSNPGAADVPIDVFAWADPSVDGSTFGDIATLDGPTLTVTDDPSRATLRGVGADRFQMGGTQILSLLNDAQPTLLSNMGHLFSGNVQLALQWRRMVTAGSNVTIEYTLGLTSAPVCGDGTRDHTEACDDGNTMSGDGCSATCQPENDAGPPDAGFDAGPMLDAGMPDAGPIADAGRPDAGPIADAGPEADAGAFDAGPFDAGAGEGDAGLADAGAEDSGAGDPDAGAAVDAGPPETDSGPPAEVDSGPPGAVDAGPGGFAGGSCSCRASEPRSGRGAWGIGLLALGALVQRRRRRGVRRRA